MAVDLEQFDDDFNPKNDGGAEILADGDYDMEVAECGTKKTSNFFIIEAKFTVIEGPTPPGTTIKHAWFISDRDSANRFGKDMITLGLDADEWTTANERPFSKEVEKAVLLLPGLRFRAKKKANESKDGKGQSKTYHNLYLNKRLETDGRPARFGAEDLNEAHSVAVPF
jgi:hypothetical protein